MTLSIRFSLVVWNSELEVCKKLCEVFSQCFFAVTILFPSALLDFR